MMHQKSHLLLKEQLCFPIYAVSRMITRVYQPHLVALNLTYPQYLVMLVLWENKKLTMGALGKKLYLNTNTLTPLVKKLIEKKLVVKERSLTDERSVLIQLTEEGEMLKNLAENIPLELINSMGVDVDELLKMRELMWSFLSSFELLDVE
jgi:DNA-binding MarR family transcriptional regulator